MTTTTTVSTSASSSESMTATTPDTAKDIFRTRRWRSYIVMLFASVMVVSLAIVTGYFFNSYYPLPKAAAGVLDGLGYVLWGTGMARPKINHHSDCHHTKLLNRRLQIACAQTGIFAFVMANSLVTI